jgi:hypothetical protein
VAASWRRSLAAALFLASAGCASLTSSEAEALDVVGTWQYRAGQLSPQVDMTGTVEFRVQRGSDVTGAASWEARDALGAVRIEGGTLAGRVIGLGDIDFDIETGDGSRRHVARFVTADSMSGVWVHTGDGRSGSFSAVRELP